MRGELAALCVALAPLSAPAAPPPATLMTGTVTDANQVVSAGANTYSFCLLSARLPPGSPNFVDLGPAVSFTRQDTGSAPVTITFPGIGHGTQITGQAPFWDFYAVGAAQLVFSGASAGTVAFLPGSVFVSGKTITPSFAQFGQAWDGATGQLTLYFVVTMGDCAVPFSAVYRD